MENLTNIKTLEIDEIVRINNGLYKIGLKKWSNGHDWGYSPNLTKLTFERIQKLFIDSEKVKDELNKIDLKPSDFPTDENNLIQIDILKEINKNGN